jgi:preprotein translocase subunit SecD
MRIPPPPFNVYLLAALLAMAGLLGCKSMKKEETATLRLHLEVNPATAAKNGPVPIGRSNTAYVNIENDDFLTEAQVSKAALVDNVGGFAIMIQFDQKGTWILEQYSTANLGRRVAIISYFGEARWLAAPIMEKPIKDGVLIFTPDASHEEADKIVRGLNAVAREMQ